MTDTTPTPLTRKTVSDAVSPLGWRLVLRSLMTSVAVASLADAVAVVELAAAVCGADADGHLRADVRRDRALLSVLALDSTSVTARDVDLARRIGDAVTERGLRVDADVGSDGVRSAQAVEIAIDALDIAAVRPFWKAVMGYVDEPGRSGPQDALVDPLGQAPAIWFQQMDEPRPQRNRIHIDVSVPHDEAQRRITATLAAGGRLGYVAEAPAFWVLIDPEGNEACVTTWQGRD